MTNIKKFNLGDKVSFLNEKGGGIITKIVNNEIVHVAIEEGFEIPTAVVDIIKTDSGEYDKASVFAQNVIEETTEEDSDASPLYIAHNDSGQISEGIYVMIVPEIEDAPLTGNIEILLINHTPYQALFGLFLNKSGHYYGEDYGFIEPETQLLLTSIGRSEASEWANLLLQVSFFKEGKINPVKPLNNIINFKPIKLYKEESFKYEKIIRKKAITITAGLLSELGSALNTGKEEKFEEQEIKSLQEKFHDATIESEAKQKESFLEAHKIDDKIAEVDLHIGILTERYESMSNAEILKVQMDYFIKCMQQAEVEKLHKVIFIHGVGNGVLKNEIYKYLRNTDGVEFHDASYARYGMGATEVVFYRNK